MTRTLSPTDRRATSDDGGFTLIEVVVSLFLLGLVSTAILLFFVKGVQTSAHLQRTQAANGVATAAIEKVRAVSALDTLSVTAMVKGRAKSDVELVWDSAASIDTADSNYVWDPAALPWDPVANPSGGPVIRLRTTDTVSGIKYTATTLIGSCYRAASLTGADVACTKTNVTATGVKIYRVTAVVTWQPTAKGQCGGAATCTYRMSVLIDPNHEAAWNLTTKPVAYEDAIPVFAGGPLQKYDILANDVIGAVTANPVTLTLPGAGLWGSPAPSIITTGTEMGMLSYTPPTAASGIMTLSYKLKDAAGRTSNDANITVSVMPVAKPDTSSVAYGSSVAIDVGANDVGTFGAPKVLVVSTGPGSGTADVVGGKITYTAPPSGSPSNTTFQYTIADTSGLVSTPVTVTVSRTAPVPLVANDFAIEIPTAATSVPTDLGVIGQNPGNPVGSTIKIISGPVGVDGWANVGTVTGDTTALVRYVPVAKTVGVYLIKYQIQYPGRPSSPTMSIWVTMRPAPVADTYNISKKNTASIPLGANDLPASGMTYAISSITCGTATITPSTGMLVYTSANKDATCVVTYTVTKSGTPPLTRPSPVWTSTLTVTVKN